MAIDRLDRRALLALGLGVLACNRALGQPAEGAAYVAVETEAASGLSRAAFFAASGARLGAVPLRFRAHGMARHARQLVVFPRRPGDRFAVIDRDTLEIRAVVTAPPNAHFFGHGAFSRDGRTLLVTENDLETLQGRIGLYRLGPEVRREGQVPLPRPGPHEITRDPARDRFYIALGGLETHPAYGRAPLNLESFRSEVIALDLAGGGIEAMGLWTGSEGVSLRHLAMDGRGRLYIGGQVKEAREGGGHVLWLVDGGRVSRLESGALLGGYVSSVAAHGTKALVSSKTSNRVLCLNGARLLRQDTRSGAGAVALGDGLLALSGYDLLTVNGAERALPAGVEYDNHGLSLL